VARRGRGPFGGDHDGVGHLGDRTDGRRASGWLRRRR
jgi:hypothetical protein